MKDVHILGGGKLFKLKLFKLNTIETMAVVATCLLLMRSSQLGLCV